MSAWCELIAREEMRRDADVVRLLRAVKHAKGSEFKQLVKQLTEKGS